MIYGKAIYPKGNICIGLKYDRDSRVFVHLLQIKASVINITEQKKNGVLAEDI